MMVMPANNTHWLVHVLAGAHPGSVGHLYTPTRTERPMPHLPYGLDNGMFARALKDLDLDREAWDKSLDRYCAHQIPPKWLVVPDVPFNGEATLARWESESPVLVDRHIPLALAVQDGMTPAIVEELTLRPDVIFVGGTTEWKWATMADWCKAFPRVHVARVNGRRGLDRCVEACAESCDGSGWFRGDPRQLIELVTFIADYWNGDRARFIHYVNGSRFKTHDQLCLRMEHPPT